VTRRTIGCAGIVLAALLAVAPTVAAHHAANTKYDANKPVKLQGQVTKVEWMNPHIYYYLDVKEADGKVTNWAVEGGTPNQLYRQGWREDSLKVGDTITVEGFAAREAGLHHANGRNVTLPDGRRVYAGSNDGLPKE
jgi:hypothetical protein